MFNTAKGLFSDMTFRVAVVAPVLTSCVISKTNKPFSGRAVTAPARHFA